MTIRRISRLLADRRGTSVVELALLSPILLLTLAGMVDGARLVSTKLRLQQAAERTAELASAGGVASAAFTSLQAEAASAANVPSSKVTVTYWLECDGVKQSAFDGVCNAGQQAGRFTSITIVGSYSPSFNWNWLFGAGGSATSLSLSSSASVRVQ